MKLALVQYDPIVGDVFGNLERAVEVYESAAGEGVDLVVLSELFLCGYPPKDLLESPWFLDQVEAALERLAETTLGCPGTGLLVGAPARATGGGGRGLRNTATLLYRGRAVFRQAKSLLPFYDVFDETRYFDPSPHPQVFPFRGETLGVTVCEDAWNDAEMWLGGVPYDRDPVAELAAAGATLLVNLSASPFHLGKEETRYRLLRHHARRHRLPFVYVNQVGGNDEIVFDGRSMALDAHGEPLAVLPAFAEAVKVVDTAGRGDPARFVAESPAAAARAALTLGVRDYLRKCGFRKALVGLSGGIDSAVVAALAADAIGPENVLGVTMPSAFSSAGSVADSRALAENLGIGFLEIPIAPLVEAYGLALGPAFEGYAEDVTEENIQARVRGNLLMALSNKFGRLLLSTGNKSELAVGYCTLYGDMCGGLSVIADLPKTFVYDLAAEINRSGERIPRATIEKPPSAELRPGQVDADTLPPYPVLDAILHAYIEERRSVAEIARMGHAEETVRWVTRTVDRNEYKRRQAAPGIKITPKAFGSGRRMPIAARYGS